jgi:hypothetical protein
MDSNDIETATHHSCTRCGESKPATLEFFYAKDHESGRLDSTCKECRKAKLPIPRDRYVDQRTRAEREADPRLECLECHSMKPRVEFYTTGARGRLTSRCKKCASRKQNYAMQQRVRSDWALRLLTYARCNRLKRGGVHQRCNFDRTYLFELYARQLGRCWWTSVELSLETMGLPWSVSLDRLDNTDGYVAGNIVLATRGANLARNSASPEDFKAFIQMIREV